jgi:hypothetical protein
MLPAKYSIDTKRSLLYAVSFDDEGGLQLGQNSRREPTRGGGTGFEQDLLLIERASETAATAIVPRVSVELKFNSITTHDSIVYSEKARRIRAIYPFVRYGLILGGLEHVPARTIRLGAEFDFIVAIPSPIKAHSLSRLVRCLWLRTPTSSRSVRPNVRCTCPRVMRQVSRLVHAVRCLGSRRLPLHPRQVN